MFNCCKRKTYKIINIKSNDECHICLDNLNSNYNKVCKIIYCNHIYHEKCLNEWFKYNNICPVCGL